jgi:hypothetical protein
MSILRYQIASQQNLHENESTPIDNNLLKPNLPVLKNNLNKNKS